jgi:hypothetical protein
LNEPTVDEDHNIYSSDDLAKYSLVMRSLEYNNNNNNR